ncbi:CLUMA_CG019191, isoform A [Clunio marinus]|uniref:CLUMA_CG019191, isoform A n=1 Tax=Clunio marinus TaxID=568069 RepID=A0A1J1J2Y9_9DIPT|nr:CLUMA_CG019191, isoform A [Clunio marinus]
MSFLTQRNSDFHCFSNVLDEFLFSHYSIGVIQLGGRPERHTLAVPEAYLALPLAFPSEISENNRGINLALTVDAMVLPHMPLTLNKATIRQLKKFFTTYEHYFHVNDLLKFLPRKRIFVLFHTSISCSEAVDTSGFNFRIKPWLTFKSSQGIKHHQHSKIQLEHTQQSKSTLTAY